MENEIEGGPGPLNKFFRSGYVMVALAAVAWSFKSILVKIAYDYGIDTMTLIIMRTTPVVPFAFLALYLTEGWAGFRLNLGEFMGMALIGLMGMGGSMFFSFRSIELLEASIATLVVFVYPAITILIQTILERRIRPIRVLAAFVTFGGLGLVLGGDIAGKDLSIMGIVFGLIAATTFSFNNILSEKMMRGMSPVKLTAWSMLIFTICFDGAFGNRSYPREPVLWLIALALGLVIGLFPYLLFLHGIRKIGAGPTGVINSLGPVMTVVWAILFLGENRQGIQFLGIAVVIGGILILRLEGRFSGKKRSALGDSPAFREADKKLLALLYVPIIKKPV